MSNRDRRALQAIGLMLFGLYLLSGRRWSDEGRLRRRLKSR
ncbi:MAG: hypothetical protein WKH64_16055 [Chloroflexia bacterium]